MVRYLADLGHKRIAFINGPKDWTVSQDRLQGYEAAALETNVDLDPELIAFADFTQVGGYREVRSLLNTGASFTAVFAADDLMAIGAVQALKEHGLRVPGSA